MNGKLHEIKFDAVTVLDPVNNGEFEWNISISYLFNLFITLNWRSEIIL